MARSPKEEFVLRVLKMMGHGRGFMLPTRKGAGLSMGLLPQVHLPIVWLWYGSKVLVVDEEMAQRVGVG